jgi:hypothetical protein
MLADGVFVKARSLIDAENTGHSTHDAADHTANNGSDRTGVSFAFSRASLDPPRNPLRLSHGRESYGGGEGGNSDKAADHDVS